MELADLKRLFGGGKLPSFAKVSRKFKPCDTDFYIRLGYNVLEGMLHEGIVDKKLLEGVVIDLGCGAGSFGGIISKVMGGQVHNVDNNVTPQLEAYRGTYIEAEDFFEYDNLEYLEQQPPQSVDLITCLDCEPFDYKYYLQLLDASKRVLKEGGKFIATIRSLGWKLNVSSRLPELKILELPIKYPGESSVDYPYSANQTFVYNG